MRKHLKDVLAIILIGLMSFILIESTQSSLFRIDQTTDSNVYQYVAHIIKDGGMPYRDTFDHKGPVVYLVNYLALSANYGTWLISLTLIFITILSVYLICRKVLHQPPLLSLIFSLLSLTLLLLFSDDTFNITETYLIPLVAISSYIFLDYYMNNKLSNLRLLLCGCLLGLAILIKPNYAAIWLAFASGVIYQFIKKGNYRELLRIVLTFTIGAVVTIVPFLIWLILNGAWSDFISQFVTFNFAYASDPQWANPLSRLDSLLELLDNILLLGAVVIVFFLILQKNLLKQPAHFALTINTIVLFTTIIITVISGQTYHHYGYTFAPLIFLPYALLLTIIPKKQTPIILLAVIPLFATAFFSPWSTAAMKAATSFSSRNSPKVSSAVSDIAKIIQKETTPNDKITVFGNWDFIYNYTDRLSASQYSFQYPIAEIDRSIADKYIQDLEYNLPKLIIYHPQQESFSLNEKLTSFIEQHHYMPIYTNEDNIKVYRKE